MCKIKNLVKQYFRDISGLTYTPFLTDGMCELLKIAKQTDSKLYDSVYNLIHSSRLEDKYKREHTIFVSLSDYINVDECTNDVLEEIIYNREELHTREIKELQADFVEDIVNMCKDKVAEILNDNVFDYLISDSMTYTYEHTMLISNVGACYPNGHINHLMEIGVTPTVENVAYEFLRDEYANTIIDSFDYDIDQFNDYLKEELLKHYCKSYTS